MSTVGKSRFDYVTFIRTTPPTLWQALTEATVIRRYWFDTHVECDWTKGSPWTMARPDGTLMDTGEIAEIEPGKRMVIRWQNEWTPELRAEGPSRCTIELEPVDDAVKLSVTHENDLAKSKFIQAVSIGWPMVLSNLKSLLETGTIVVTTHPGH